MQGYCLEDLKILKIHLLFKFKFHCFSVNISLNFRILKGRWNQGWSDGGPRRHVPPGTHIIENIGVAKFEDWCGETKYWCGEFHASHFVTISMNKSWLKK